MTTFFTDATCKKCGLAYYTSDREILPVFFYIRGFDLRIE